jgi:hypothetical protein
MKEKQFHGEHFSPGQGKRPDQYEKSAKAAAYAIASIVVLFLAAVLATVISVIT